MSGWGIKDDKTSTGTIAMNTSGEVSGTSTAFTTEAKVGDILTANSIDFRITAIEDDGSCDVVNADTPGAAIAAISAGEAYTLSEKPTMLGFNSVGGYTSETVYGVDQTEMGVAANNGPAHAGWVHVQTVGSRKKYETLVALSSGSSTAAAMGDAEETEFPDS